MRFRLRLVQPAPFAVRVNGNASREQSASFEPTRFHPSGKRTVSFPIRQPITLQVRARRAHAIQRPIHVASKRVPTTLMYVSFEYRDALVAKPGAHIGIASHCQHPIAQRSLPLRERAAHVATTQYQRRPQNATSFSKDCLLIATARLKFKRPNPAPRSIHENQSRRKSATKTSSHTRI